MIKYRPHRGSLADAMAEYREFNNVAAMLEYIQMNSSGLVNSKDIVISESHGSDDRIGWNSSRYVCVTQFGPEKYDVPQVIGMCDLGECG